MSDDPMHAGHRPPVRQRKPRELLWTVRRPALLARTIRCLPRLSRTPRLRRWKIRQTPGDAPQTWTSGPVTRSMQRLKAAGVLFVLVTHMGGGLSREHDPTPAY